MDPATTDVDGESPGGAESVTVLHLEDSDVDAEFVRTRLEKAGLRVVLDRAVDRESYIARLKRTRYDLILSDYQLPQLEGLEALELARRHHPETPFIFLSGTMGEELAVETLKRGATDYILKDRITRLPVAIERAMGETRQRAERKRAEEAARRAEVRAGTILESITDGFFTLDSHWRFIYVNRQAEKTLHRGPGDLLGKVIWDELPGLIDTAFAHTYRRVAKSRVAETVTDYYPEHECWYEVRTYPTDEGLSVYFRDVTPRIESDRKLREANEANAKFRTMFEQGSQFAALLSLDGTVIEANRLLMDECGYTREDIINCRFWECGWWNPSEELASRIRELTLAAAGGDQVRTESDYYVADGGKRIVDLYLAPVRSGDGEILFVAATGTDITDRKRAEEKLAQTATIEKRRSALLARVAAASRSINAVLSAESIVRTLTEEACAIIGAGLAVTTYAASDRESVRQVVGGNEAEQDFDADLVEAVSRENRSIRRPRGTDDPGDAGRLAVPLLGHGGRNIGVIQLVDKTEGDFTVEDEAILVQLASIAAVGIENARLFERVREQDRRKDEFLATLAHELRNPLAPIRTGLTVLQMLNSPEEMAETRKMMQRQVSHMVRLIDDLLDVSRITRGKLELKRERVDLRTVFDAALEVARPTIDAGHHTLVVAQPDETLIVDADPTRLAQVISNLLNNAAKYTPEGGRVELSAKREGAEAVISVRDNGVGIAPELLPKVFEMFTQAGGSIDRAQGGLGIGLALVARLVQMHGGRATAESDGLHRGSRFVIRLPLADTASGPIAEGPRHERNSVSDAWRILVVDDNVDGAQTLATLLKLAGHTTATAYNGPSAIETAQAFAPQVIFLDIGLPGMNGYEVAQRLRSMSGDDGPVLIALTGWGTDADRRHAEQSGFDHHLTKPVDAARLQALLNDLIL